LDRSQNGRDVVSGTPLILQNVQANAAIGVNIGMEHFGDELDNGSFVGVFLSEPERESERAIFEGGVVRSKNDGVPLHQIPIGGRTGNARWRINLQFLEIADEAARRRRGHRKRCAAVAKEDFFILSRDVLKRSP